MALSIARIRTEELEDLTTCCICTEVYTNPKALPCIHTFCLKCIEETGRQNNKRPGDHLPCPICRQRFRIPRTGFEELPTNFIIEKIMQMIKVSNPSSSTLCRLCLEESKEQEQRDIRTAASCCIDCKYTLCEECCRHHATCSLTKDHIIMPIQISENSQGTVSNLAPAFCKVHRENAVDLYCADCKTVACATCFCEEHKDHESLPVSRYVTYFLKQLQDNTETMNECISEAQQKKAELVKVKSEMKKRVKSLKCDITARQELIKWLADEHAGRLQKRLSSQSEDRLDAINMEIFDLNAYVTYLECHNTYYQGIMAGGLAEDICRALSDLSLGTIELQNRRQEVIERENLDFKFCLRRSKLEEFLGDGNLIGDIEEPSKEIDILRRKNQELIKITANLAKALKVNAERLGEEAEASIPGDLRYRSEPVLVQTIRTRAAEEKGKEIRGLTILDKELFVVSQKSSQIEIFDSMKFRINRRWNLKDLADPLDIASCNRNQCLYIMDFKGREQSKEILRVETDGKLIRKWSTGDDYGWGLCVTDESNVILAVYKKHKLSEYSPDGQLIREINLSSDAGVRLPWHAVQMTNGHFVVSYGATHRLCVVDADGKLKKSCAGVDLGLSVGPINSPVYLSVDGYGFVMVVDRRNRRVLLLDSDLELKREILTEKHGLGFPWRILLDETNRRLIVADNEADNQQIFIFDQR